MNAITEGKERELAHSTLLDAEEAVGIEAQGARPEIVVIGEREDAARAMVFEAAGHERHAGSGQRRGNGIAVKARIFTALEFEAQLTRAIEPLIAVPCQSVHHGAGLCGNPRRTESAGNVSITTSRKVSRNTTNQNPEAM